MGKKQSHVAAVIATYNSSSELVDNYRCVMGQVDAVFIVDDGSSESTPVLDECAALGAHVVRFEKNAGIARSLNAGIELARASGAEYVLTLDQDTRIPDNYVESLVSTIKDLRQSGVNVGLVTAGRMNGGDRRPRSISDGLAVGIDVMQSGCLYEMATLREVGPFREDFVIDCVDTEYCLRLRQRGSKIVWVPGLELNHTVGATSPIRVFGLPVVIVGRAPHSSHHADFRRYYMSRNRLMLYKEFGSVDREWLWHSLRSQAKDTLLAVVFEPGRRSRVRAISRGVIDAIRNRTGLMESYEFPEE